jgi:hypothetical protein
MTNSDFREFARERNMNCLIRKVAEPAGRLLLTGLPCTVLRDLSKCTVKQSQEPKTDGTRRQI